MEEKISLVENNTIEGKVIRENCWKKFKNISKKISLG
jgi:hypothetical protein